MDTNEKEIIHDIISLNAEFVNFLLYAKKESQLINNKMNKIDNHFFTDNQEIITLVDNIYNHNHIDKMINSIDINTEQLNDSLNNCCIKHDFVNDYIDTTFGDNIKITYCTRCNVSKK